MADHVRVIKIKSLIEKVGLGRSSIYAMMKKGQFPKPIKLGFRSVGWLENEIDNWIETHAKQRSG